MGLKSEKTGGSIEVPDNGVFPAPPPGKLEVRGGGIPARKDKTRIEIHPGAAINAASTFAIVVCVFGILNGVGVILPTYSWACIGILIGVINPMGRSKRS